MPDDEGHSAFDGNSAGAQGSTAYCLEFVNMNASSKAEKQRNQRVIRSTAMKNFRRRQQSQRMQAKGEKKTTNEAHTWHLPQGMKEREASSNEDRTDGKEQHIKDECSQDPEDLSFHGADDWSSQSTLSDSWHEHRANSSGNFECPLDSVVQVGYHPGHQTSNDFFPLDSPITLLGGGRIDPFRIYPVDDVGPHVHELIDHSTALLWPGLRPRGAGGCENKISSAWLEKVTSRPLVMHAMLFGGAVHIDVLRSPRISLNNPVRLFHKIQTMRMLKEELKNPGMSDLDELILAVLTLGANEVETMADNMNPKVRSPFNSPLSSTQWLDVYGSMPKIKAHTLAMRSLVDRRGGLEMIQLEGLAEVIEFADILGATQNLSKPYWPLLDRTAKAHASHGHGLLYHPLMSLGQGFQALKVFGISDDAASVLREMADLTVVIECYSRGIAPVPDLSIVIDRRNFVQHALLSLPTADELEFGEVSSVYLYESIRYTAIIYSIAVTFPLPPMTGIYDKLTALLKSVLEESKVDICWRLYPKVLLWVLTLGGIAASVTPNRTWYVQKLSVVSAALHLWKWEDVAEVMGHYLWLERACDAGGRKLWLEVNRERCLDSDFEEEDN